MHATISHPSAATGLSPAQPWRQADADAPRGPENDADAVLGTDSAGLMTLFGVFTVTPLIVVGALLGAVAIGTWWALVLLMVVHFATTAVVFGAVAEVMSGRRPHLGLRPS